MEEIAAEVGISKEDIVYALDAMQNPMSLYEPVYTDGGDTLYVMDQISDKKNKEETWVEHLSLSEAMKRLNDRERHIISLRFFEDPDRGGRYDRHLPGPGLPSGKKCIESHAELSHRVDLDPRILCNV